MTNQADPTVAATNLAAHTVIDRGVGIPDRLTRLWAPYRMHYIADRVGSTAGTEATASATPTDDGDPFVQVVQLDDREGLIVARGKRVFSLLNLYPYNAGHLLVVPYRKVAALEELTTEEANELMAFAQAAIRVIKTVSNPDGINAGFNLGHDSGGSVKDHLHMHIVPRWAGDANFMTVIDGTKVLPQVLQDTRTLLATAWANDPTAPGTARA